MFVRALAFAVGCVHLSGLENINRARKNGNSGLGGGDGERGLTGTKNNWTVLPKKILTANDRASLSAGHYLYGGGGMH